MATTSRWTLFVGLVLMHLGRASAVEQTTARSPAFAKDIAPILYKNCVSCHRPGEMAPMSLLTYEEVRPWARAIATKVSDGSMPPWHAEAPSGTFSNERRLSPSERQTILDWVKSGALLGNSADLPDAPKFAAGWTIGSPDAVVSMVNEYEVPASGEVPYQYFEAATNFAEDKWVQAIEVRHSAPGVVHHVLVFSRDPGGTTRQPGFAVRKPAPAESVRNALAARAANPPEQGRRSTNRGVLIATTAPGTNAQVFPPGQAMLIKAGSVVTFQVHYTVNGRITRDRTSVGFVFARQKPLEEVRSGAFMNTTFVIPPGDANHRVESAIEFLQDSKILAIFPHTHLRGKSWEYRIEYPDGRSELVLSVPKYDFNWQTCYEFVKPLNVPKGARLEGAAHYDNSLANRANPDSRSAVRWGDQTWEEMQYTGITFIVQP